MMNSITTIQIRENVKDYLDRLKEDSGESYEQVILNLIKVTAIQKRKQRELLIEGCKEMAKENLAMTKEWEATDAELDWEWYDDKKRRHSSSKS